MLLNPGDRFRINVVLSGDFNEPAVDARIAGISEVSRKLLKPEHKSSESILLLIVGAITTWAYGYLGMASGAVLRANPVSLMRRGDSVAITVVLGMASTTIAMDALDSMAASRVTTFWVYAAGALILTFAVVLGAFRLRRMHTRYRIESSTGDVRRK